MCKSRVVVRRVETGEPREPRGMGGEEWAETGREAGGPSAEHLPHQPRGLDLTRDGGRPWPCCWDFCRRKVTRQWYKNHHLFSTSNVPSTV